MILGVTGTLGAGKGTVVDYLKTKGFKHFAVSDTFLAGEAEKRGLPPTRDNRRDIANEYRAKGPTKLMEAVLEFAKDDIDAGNDVVIDPQHTKAEVEFIQSMGGFEIAVDADLPIRYERIQKRGSSKDDVSYEEFAAAQILEMASDDPNKNNLGMAIAVADARVTNNGSLEELYSQVDEVLSKCS
jgi:dephospho-CoA kinase